MKFSKCHPDQKHEAYGMCRRCYVNWCYKNKPGFKDKVKKRSSDWALKNPEKARDRYDKWVANNKDRSNEIKRVYADKHKDRCLKASSESRKRNRPARSAECAAYKARKAQRTPKWADLEKIKQIYKDCPRGLAVDHIVPLFGRNVCGLHVENNLQYLTKQQNSKKGNKF
jgi:hypothetical protein